MTNITSDSLDRLTAIAVKYDRTLDKAPKVLERGEGLIAEEIIKIAKEHKIPIVQNEDVAKILKRCEIDSFIPVEAYLLVAQILSKIFTYRNNEPD